MPPEPTRTRATAPASSCRSRDAFFRGVVGESLPPAGRYGVAMCFLPQDATRRAELESRLQAIAEEEGQRVVCWRDVPVDPAHVGVTAGAAAPSSAS